MPTAAAAPGAVAASIPESVKSFVSDLYREIRDGNLSGIHALYEDTFYRLSASVYHDTPWPTAQAVAAYCDGDQVFLFLYRELTFRHAHARLPSLTLKHRTDSWYNYCRLFDVVLQDIVSKELPNQWLWDMVDEFVYQFQRFCEDRAKLDDKTKEEINLLKHFDQVWNVYGVLSCLKALVEKSMITEILEREKEGLEQFTGMTAMVGAMC